jgi:integrase/recombinase XerC
VVVAACSARAGRATRDYRSYLVTVAKRATATVNKHLAAVQDFYVWRGLGQPQGVKRDQVPRHAPKALEPRAKLRYLRAVEARAPGSPRSAPWTSPTSG